MSVARVPDVEIDARIYRASDLDRLRVRDGEIVELIDGEVFVTPSPSPDHQRIVGRLYRALVAQVTANGMGEVFFAPLDVSLDDSTVLVPDIVLVLSDRAGIVTDTNVTGVPSLVVEVVSPSSRRLDGFVKRGRYARAGVPEYWVVDPVGLRVLRHSSPLDGAYADVLVANRDDDLLSATFEGVSVELRSVFAGIGRDTESQMRDSMASPGEEA